MNAMSFWEMLEEPTSDFNSSAFSTMTELEEKLKKSRQSNPKMFQVSKKL